MECVVSSEVQRICSLFHYGWISKKDAGYFERNSILYRDVQNALAVMGYELINYPYCDWYIIRLKKEFNHDAFEKFSKYYRGITRRHLALIFILYTKLLFPKKAGIVDWSEELYITLNEISLNYGTLFQKRKTSSKGVIQSLLRLLARLYFVIESNGKYFPGPSLYMIHNEMMDEVQEAILLGLSEKFKKLAEENSNDDRNEVKEEND